MQINFCKNIKPYSGQINFSHNNININPDKNALIDTNKIDNIYKNNSYDIGQYLKASKENIIIKNYYIKGDDSSIETNPFKVENLYSTGQKLEPEVHFIDMKAYGRDFIWAAKMNNLIYQLSDMINSDCDFEALLKKAEEEIKAINSSNKAYCVPADTGFLSIMLTAFKISPQSRGSEYLEKIINSVTEWNENGDGFVGAQANKEYEDANTTEIITEGKTSCRIFYGRCLSELKNLKLAKKEYEKLKSIENPTKEQIISSCATIQWLIAQEGPYLRGNDSVANALTKSIFHAYGIEISPLKKDTSLDFEAFYRDLDDYIEAYPTFFQKEPDFID